MNQTSFQEPPFRCASSQVLHSQIDSCGVPAMMPDTPVPAGEEAARSADGYVTATSEAPGSKRRMVVGGHLCPRHDREARGDPGMIHWCRIQGCKYRVCHPDHPVHFASLQAVDADAAPHAGGRHVGALTVSVVLPAVISAGWLTISHLPLQSIVTCISNHASLHSSSW